jgi:hypothetical protein
VSRVNQNTPERKGKYAGWFLRNNKPILLGRDGLIDMLVNHEVTLADGHEYAYVMRHGCRGYINMPNKEMISLALEFELIEEERFFVEKGEEWL